MKTGVGKGKATWKNFKMINLNTHQIVKFIRARSLMEALNKARSSKLLENFNLILDKGEVNG
jgi:hypothetical protein